VTRQQHLASVFNALGDPTRVRLVEHLRTSRRCVCDLEAALDMGQSLVSFHLKVLKDAGLIVGERSGRWVYYSLAPESVHSVEELLAVAASAPLSRS
jgi:ArsR family transcriptional regulator, arsenate/arsenite/antimonite-responsive transcriptional repressor